MAYTDSTKVADAYGSTLTTAQSSFLTNTLLPSIDAIINRMTGTAFGTTGSTISIYVSGENTSSLIIPTMHGITGVSSIDSTGVETVIDPTTYTLYPRTSDGSGDKFALIMRNATWDEGFENFKVTGVLGYSSVPADIASVATAMAVNGLKVSTAQYKSERVGDWQVVYRDIENSINTDSQAILAGYKRLSRSI